MGYIPTTKLASISNKAARCHALANLYHMCMHDVLGSISSYGKTGLDMLSRDGVWHWCHPIFAAFISDYPEQALVTCTYYGRCPKCTVPPTQLGKYGSFPPRIHSTLLDTYQLVDSDFHTFHHACGKVGMKPIYHPFWESLPLVDAFHSITPNILHQVHQGMVKHIISWVSGIFGAAAIDARCRAIPPGHDIMLFTKGISSLSHVLGLVHKRIAAILLGLVANLSVPGGQDSTRIIWAVRALMDFIYLAQYRSHTTDTISKMWDCLKRFHDNKCVFIDLGIREHFHLPKLHSLGHYASSIKLFGTTGNYNTEQTECFHIDFTKDAYCATNHKNEYSQMTRWLECRERIQVLSDFLNWTPEHGEGQSSYQDLMGPACIGALTLKMAQGPSQWRVLFDVLARDNGALEFQDTLADFIA